MEKLSAGMKKKRKKSVNERVPLSCQPMGKALILQYYCKKWVFSFRFKILEDNESSVAET